jgi:hypothetical protein
MLGVFFLLNRPCWQDSLGSTVCVRSYDVLGMWSDIISRLWHFVASVFFFCGTTAELGPRSLIVEVYRSHTTRHTEPVGLLWTSDQPVAEGASYTTHNRLKRQTFMPSAGFEPAIPLVKRLQTCVLHRTATGIGRCLYFLFVFQNRYIIIRLYCH